jgi:Putative beta-barrel porin-2, OmpL-like. bbp2
MDVRVLAIRRSRLPGRSIAFACLIALTSRYVHGQQAYIPWSDGSAAAEIPAGTGPRPGSLSGAGALFDSRSSTSSATDIARFSQEIQQQVPLPDSPVGITVNATGPGELPTLPDAGLPQSTAAAVTPSSASDTFDTGPQTYDSFLRRLGKAYFNPEEQEKEAEANTSRGQVTPFNSPPFPFSYHMGPVIGTKDTSLWPLMDAIYNGPNGEWWKKSRIKIYGWADPSVTFGTSQHSNVPLSYSIVPNSLQLSQAILIFERQTDSVQKDHVDWGFKFTNLYGIDYRYTTAKGYFSDQLLKHNRLYGYDPLQIYGDLYLPHIAEGMIIRLGRYISPIDIEAQLSPENYLYTHSLMYTYDPYTFTGLQFITKLNDQYTLMLGVHAGNDMAPWTTSSQPNGEFLLRWVSKSGNDSLFGGVDSVGKGQYLNGHDDLQVAALTWSHKFTEKFHMLTESYYIWERNALQGGTVTNGPPQPFFESVGPGKFLPGISDSFGLVNYAPYKLSDKSYVVLRNDVLYDPRGFRTGVPGTVAEVTLGYVYHITPWCVTRPEVRFDYGTAKVYDNSTKRDQFTFNWDVIVRF